MLHQTMKVGDKIVITLHDGRRVTLEATYADRKRCRIGVTADRDIPVMRAELLEYEETGTGGC